ncbi:Endogenous retrovirus group FC1 Env polyprotein [Plecturocebus cupreus]
MLIALSLSFRDQRTPTRQHLSSQLEVYGEAELLSLLPPSPNHRDRRAIFLLMVVGLSLASSLVAAGLGSGALGYSVTLATQLEDKLREASAASLASLQRQITSLARQEAARKKRRPISSKGSEWKAGCLARRPDTPNHSALGTHLCTHLGLHTAPTSEHVPLEGSARCNPSRIFR